MSVVLDSYTLPYATFNRPTLNLEAEPNDKKPMPPSSISPRRKLSPASPCGPLTPSSGGLSPAASPNGATRPVSWDETLALLARQLNTICRTPATNTRAHTAPCSPRPVSPNVPEKKVPISHIQSNEKFSEKLSTIVYGSPRRGSITPDAVPSPQVARRNRRSRKKSLVKNLFKATVQIGECRIEELSVRVEDNTFKVTCTCIGNVGDLPANIELPKEVNPEKLICVVKDGVLEIRESKKRAMVVPKVTSGGTPTLMPSPNHSVELRRTVSFDPSKARPLLNSQSNKSSERTPLVVESDDNAQLKLVMQIPACYTMDDIHLKTVDTHLIVSASRNKTEHDAQQCGHRCSKSDDEVFQVFELPDRVDPYSIEATLTDKQQLVIQVSLLPI